MVTWPRLGLPEWPRWLLGQDGDLRSVSYDHMANTGTARVAQMTIMSRLGLLEWPRWLHGQHEDDQSGQDGYMAKMGTSRVV